MIFYPILLGPIHIGVDAAFSALLLPLRRTRACAYRTAVQNIWLFLAYLLVSGTIFHLLWTELVFTKLYCNWDYLIDFTPFWPPNRQDVTMVCNSHSHPPRYPVSYTTTVLVWGVFALASWATSLTMFLVTKKLMKRRKSNIRVDTYFRKSNTTS